MDMQDSYTNYLPCDKVLEWNPLCIFNICRQKLSKQLAITLSELILHDDGSRSTSVIWSTYQWTIQKYIGSWISVFSLCRTGIMYSLHWPSTCVMNRYIIWLKEIAAQLGWLIIQLPFKGGCLYIITNIIRLFHNNICIKLNWDI